MAFCAALGIFAVRMAGLTDIKPTLSIGQTVHTEIGPEQQKISIDPMFWKQEPAVTAEVKSIANSIFASTTQKTQITAKSYLVGNIKTGRVYAELKSDTSLPVASISKLITALAATQTYTSDKLITVTLADTQAPADGSQLIAGETFSVKELLYPLLISSSNVAAEALASSTNRDEFFNLMSSYAWEIGMPGSFFADPSGIDSRNRASAKDIFVLAQYLSKYRPDILVLTKTAKTSLATTTDHGAHTIISTHPFVSDSRFLGGKTGRTLAAGETMLTILSIKDQQIAFIVLGSDYGMREQDTKMLIAKTQDLI